MIPPSPSLCSAACSAFAGDMTCQLISIEIDHSSSRSKQDGNEDERGGGLGAGGSKIARIAPEIDWGRAARFTLIGATFLAPVLHTWYGFLARRLPGTAAATVVKRVALDQLVFAPVFLASFLSVVMLLDGNAAKVMLETVFDTVSETALWVCGWHRPCQSIMFQVFFCRVCTLLIRLNVTIIGDRSFGARRYLFWPYYASGHSAAFFCP